MAHRRKLGNFAEPIEILDSGDDSQTFGYSSLIDLTQGDQILPLTPPILQQPATKNKYSSTSSAVDTCSHTRQPLELPSRQFSFAEGQNTRPLVENETETWTSLVSLPGRVLQTDNDGFIGDRPQVMSEDDADGGLSDIMRRSAHRRFRRTHEPNSRTFDHSRRAIPTSSSTVVRGPSSQLTDSEAERNHHGKIRQGIWIQG